MSLSTAIYRRFGPQVFGYRLSARRARRCERYAFGRLLAVNGSARCWGRGNPNARQRRDRRRPGPTPGWHCHQCPLCGTVWEHEDECGVLRGPHHHRCPKPGCRGESFWKMGSPARREVIRRSCESEWKLAEPLL